MITNHNSRRSFLSSLAILSAGTVFSSVPGFITSSGDTELQQLWKAFVRNHSGNKVTADKLLSQQALCDAVQGHRVATGNHIHFATDGLIAVPCWSYWNKHQKPSDLLVTFFSDGLQRAKIICINRFELEGLTQLLTGNEERSIKPLLSGLKKRGASSQSLSIKTKITGGQPPETIATIAHRPISFTKNLIYNI